MNRFIDFLGFGQNVNRPPPTPMAQIEGDIASGQQKLDLANSLMGAEYVPNSGIWGVISQVAQSMYGQKLAKDSNEKITDAISRRMQEMNKAEDAKRLAAAAEEQRKLNALREQRRTDANAMGITGKDIERYAITGEMPKASKMKFDKGFFINEETGQVVKNDDWLKAQEQIKRAGVSAPQPRAPSALAERIELAKAMGATPEQLKALVMQEKPMGAAEAKQKQGDVVKGASLENALNIIGKLEEKTARGVGGPVAASGLNPFTSTMNPFSDAGQQIEEYDGQANMLIDELTRIQRVPGIGAQSNQELENIIKMIPTANKTEKTRTELLAQIKKKLLGLQSGYGFDPAPSSDGWSIEAVE